MIRATQPPDTFDAEIVAVRAAGEAAGGGQTAISSSSFTSRSLWVLPKRSSSFAL